MTYKKKVLITLSVVLPLIILSLIYGILVGFVKYISYDPLLLSNEIEPAVLGTSPQHFEELGLKKEKIELFEDGLRTKLVKGDYEWWYYDAHFTNGSKAVVIFYTKD